MNELNPPTVGQVEGRVYVIDPAGNYYSEGDTVVYATSFGDSYQMKMGVVQRVEGRTQTWSRWVNGTYITESREVPYVVIAPGAVGTRSGANVRCAYPNPYNIFRYDV